MALAARARCERMAAPAVGVSRGAGGSDGGWTDCSARFTRLTGSTALAVAVGPGDTWPPVSPVSPVLPVTAAACGGVLWCSCAPAGGSGWLVINVLPAADRQPRTI